MEIRKMNNDDWEEVRIIYEEGISTHNSTIISEIMSFEEFDKNHLTAGRYVAIVNEKIVGWTMLTKVSLKEAYRGVAEVSVYIKKEFQHQNIGTALLNNLIIESEKEGFWSLQSLIFVENIASIKLHEKCGFRYVGTKNAYGKDILGKWRDIAIYERRSDVIW